MGLVWRILSDEGGESKERFHSGMILSGPALAVALVATTLSKGGCRSRTWIAYAALLSAMHQGLWARTMIVAYGAPTVADVDTAFWHFLLVFPIGVSAYGWLLNLVLPVAPRPAGPPPTSPLSFDAGVRVLWTGSATGKGRLLTGLLLAAASVGVAAFSIPGALVMLFLAAVALNDCTSRVRVDNHGVSLGRAVGWPTRQLPLGRIVRAGSRPVSSPELYSEGLEGVEGVNVHSLVLGAGDLLVIDVSDELPLHVSVDHADEAADVINALIARARASA